VIEVVKLLVDSRRWVELCNSLIVMVQLMMHEQMTIRMMSDPMRCDMLMGRWIDCVCSLRKKMI
jgi:hypothetical protein